MFLKSGGRKDTEGRQARLKKTLGKLGSLARCGESEEVRFSAGG